jgi:branched-chain amino acid transport system ATP-binding protein
MTAPALDCRSLKAGYGDLAVVHGLDLQVAAGSVLALLGPNGSGKTTLMLTISGFIPRLAGEVLLGGEVLPNGRPGKANRAGVVLVPDDRALFPKLTVREHLELAGRRHASDVDDAIELFPGLSMKLGTAAGALSGGEQQMLALGRAIVQKPRVMLIDEMSMGLAPIVAESLLETIRRIADTTSTAVIIVEQHVPLALRIADEAAVLVHGDLVLSEKAAALAGHPERLEAAYLDGGGPQAG